MRSATAWWALLLVLSIPALAQETVLIAPDVPTDLDGTTYLPWEVVRTDTATYSIDLVLPARTPINALHLMDGGDWLLTVAVPWDLGGATYDPRDVVRFDETDFSLFFDGAAGGLPEGARIDSLLLDGGDAGDLVIGFDSPTKIDTAMYAAADLVRLSGGVFSLFLDASAATPPIPPSSNVSGASLQGTVQVLTFDVPTTLDTRTWLPGELIAWDGATFSEFQIDASWPVQSRVHALHVIAGEAVCRDSDEDGYGFPGDPICPAGAEEDCDDGDAGINPDAIEICNGDDDDCDGLVDEDEAGEDTDLDGVPNACDNCPGLENPDQFDTDDDGFGNLCDEDDDGDTVLDLDDCAPLSRGISEMPGPIGESLIVSLDIAAALRWSRAVQGPTSNVYRGAIDRSVGWSYEVTCLLPEHPLTVIEDPAVPAPGSGFFYLISANNACGESRMGVDSNGLDLFPTVPCAPQARDTDGDSVPDVRDNCSVGSNPDQFDGDLDFVGDACDGCPDVPDPHQDDSDQDGMGDACDTCTDTDEDGFGNPEFPVSICTEDNCPVIFNPTQADGDADDLGDVCDECPVDPQNDVDDDSFCANQDNCPDVHNPSQRDEDANGIGDACDTCTDGDGDGFADPGFPATTCDEDNCPLTANPLQEDDDGDGIGNVCDVCPDDPLDDEDEDGECGDLDNCPQEPNPDQTDGDGDGLGDVCDPCPNNPSLACEACPPVSSTDLDGDGVCESELVQVELGSAMRYLANGADPVLGEVWTAETFDDASWSDGTYGVGYDTDDSANDLIQATVPDGSYSVYTRAGFNIAKTNGVVRLFLAADWDDGYAAWLNGVEVYRSPQMPVGPLDWSTDAASHESSNATLPQYGTPVDIAPIGLPILKSGDNVLAVGVWNRDAPSAEDLVLVPRLWINGDSVDNCPDVPNPDQADSDADGLGDACD